MTQQEFKAELRRHLIAIIRACMLFYGMTWADFQPRDETYTPGPNSTSTLPFDMKHETA